MQSPIIHPSNAQINIPKRSDSENLPITILVLKRKKKKEKRNEATGEEEIIRRSEITVEDRSLKRSTKGVG